MGASSRIASGTLSRFTHHTLALMPQPLLYEINTRCWLRELSEREKQAVTLANVPEAEVAGWERLGFTHIWLMGVWTTGPRARAEALAQSGLREACARLLPDWTEAD